MNPIDIYDFVRSSLEFNNLFEPVYYQRWSKKYLTISKLSGQELYLVIDENRKVYFK